MRRIFSGLLIFYVLVAGLGFLSLTYGKQAKETDRPREMARIAVIPSVTPKVPDVSIVAPRDKYSIPQSQFISQTFNNCGPASLAMVMAMYGTNVSQKELGDKMRPYQHPSGDNDDKSVFADEFVTYAKEYGFEGLHRPNGTLSLIKQFTANDIPVVVRTWLNSHEDIGHFRIVKGYDDTKQIIIQDDSYQGADLTYSYDEFLSLWQPFNYGYILVYPAEKKDVVEKILADEMNERTAWQHALSRAEKEYSEDPGDAYAQFNIATASYYLGDYHRSVQNYEAAADQLPWRMLWYQIEPIKAYQKTGNAGKVFSLTEKILSNNNRAFSELYFIRGEMFNAQGNKDAAKAEYENAVFYNENFAPAKAALSAL